MILLELLAVVAAFGWAVLLPGWLVAERALPGAGALELAVAGAVLGLAALPVAGFGLAMALGTVPSVGLLLVAATIADVALLASRRRWPPAVVASP